MLAEGSSATREDGIVAHDTLLPQFDLGRPAGVSRAALAPPGSALDVRREHQLTVRLDLAARSAVVTGALRPPRVAAARDRNLRGAPARKVREERAVGVAEATRVRRVQVRLNERVHLRGDTGVPSAEREQVR